MFLVVTATHVDDYSLSLREVCLFAAKKNNSLKRGYPYVLHDYSGFSRFGQYTCIKKRNWKERKDF